MNMTAQTHVPLASSCGCAASGRKPGLAGRLRQSAASLARRSDTPLAAIALVPGLLAVLAPAQLAPSLSFTGQALLGILPWLAISVGCAAFARASGLDKLVAKAFTGRPARMIMIAALFGALSPFCSCGVIPVIAGLLAAGVPLAPVMAFWLSSPLMDPNMFALTAATLGLEFALAKTLAAIGIGLFAGTVTHVLARGGRLADTLRVAVAAGVPHAGPVKWNVLASADTRRSFAAHAGSTAWLLLRWMALAFLLESLMVAWLPAGKVVALLGEESMAIPMAVLVGVPAYFNGFAALPLVNGLVGLGMSPAVALAFLVAGGVASIPAAAAVWALARPRVFLLYLGLGASGSLLAAYAYALLRMLGDVS
jgi:uncharacterized protein